MVDLAHEVKHKGLCVITKISLRGVLQMAQYKYTTSDSRGVIVKSHISNKCINTEEL